MVQQDDHTVDDVVYLSLSVEPHGIGKFVVVNDAEQRSVYVDMTTTPPTIFGPEERTIHTKEAGVVS